MHWVGIIFAAIVILLDILFFSGSDNSSFFMFLIGIALACVILPFIIGLVIDNKRDQEIAEMFLEFSRNLAESVSTGTPISKSIVNMKEKNYGPLSPYIQKLANQISIGIPLNQALQNFAYDVDNQVITRAITLIAEAEKAGGEIDYILESSAKSIAEIEKLKKERKAAVYNITVQGYIIFFIFIGIMLVMEFKILPLAAGINSFGGLNANFGNIVGGNVNSIATSASTASSSNPATDLSSPLFFLLITQGLFAGLVIGKVTEGSLKAGIKHSFILAIAAFLISTGAKALFG